MVQRQITRKWYKADNRHASLNLRAKARRCFYQSTGRPLFNCMAIMAASLFLHRDISDCLQLPFTEFVTYSYKLKNSILPCALRALSMVLSWWMAFADAEPRETLGTVNSDVLVTYTPGVLNFHASAQLCGFS